MSHFFGLRSLQGGFVKTKVEVGRPTYILYGSDGHPNRSSWVGKVVKYDAPLSPRGRKLFLGGNGSYTGKDPVGAVLPDSILGARNISTLKRERYEPPRLSSPCPIRP